MLKDNENMPFLDDGTLVPAERQGFAPGEMVRCEVCLRSNPPTRANCLYCAAALPGAKRIIEQSPIVVKPFADSIPGFNCILIPGERDSSATDLPTAAKVLNLPLADLQKIVAAQVPLPLARTTTRAEAEMIAGNLSSLDLKTTVVSDSELGAAEYSVVTIRSAEINEAGITLKQIGGDEGMQISWSEIILIVTGRLMSKRVESSEQKRSGGKSEMLEATEFFADELVMDIYVANRANSFRIAATRFDFSFLPERGLVAAENFGKLLNLIRTRSPAAHQDDLYLSVRQSLDAVWHSEQRTGSGGWRRDRPGKYAVEAISESSNLNQFTRYSRLRYLFLNRGRLGTLV